MIHVLIASLISLSAVAQDGVRNGADGNALRTALADPTDPKNLALIHQVAVACCQHSNVVSLACPDLDSEDLKTICGE